MYIIIPGMLFYNVENLYSHKMVFLLEEESMFSSNHYSEIRIKYNRTCLKQYQQYLESKLIKCSYITSCSEFYNSIRRDSEYYSYDPLDRALREKWSRLGINFIEPLNFILTGHDINTNSFRRVNPLYKFVLNKIGHEQVLSTDKQNRSKLPIDKLGAEDVIQLPTNYKDSMKYLMSFMKTTLSDFGPYQDSIEPNLCYINHSLLSIPLNMGLITPHDILRKLIKFRNKIPMNSYEGFLRQICGWREYMYYIFVKHSHRITKDNYWNNTKKITSEWYQGNTIHPIFNNEFKKASTISYAHHIPRLMVFLCLMILHSFSPEEIIKWFKKTISLDAYDWVMVSNIYCMGYFNKEFTTRHYLCSSNYIKRMSNYYKRDKQWDELYRLKLKKQVDVSRT